MDFFTAFLGFMSILTGSVPYFPLASGEFWTFLLLFSALCPFSPALFHIFLWLPENFGLFPAFSVLYIHSHRLCSVLPSGSRMILDFFTAFLGFMSIFLVAFTPVSVFLSGFRRILDFFLLFLCFMSILTGSVPYYLLASGCFWTFLLLFSALCPFSPARFRISLWLPDVFGLFPAFSVLYVHFLLPGSVFPSGFRMILDFFTAFLDFMSIFSYPAPYFPLASG